MSAATPQEQRALELKAKPWLAPDDESWWVVTGTAEEFIRGASGKLVHKRVQHVRSLCQVSYEGGDGAAFLPVGFFDSSLAYILPSQIGAAVEVLIVRRDDPTRAAWQHDQPTVDDALAGDR